jgi:hypothetical protein
MQLRVDAQQEILKKNNLLIKSGLNLCVPVKLIAKR